MFPTEGGQVWFCLLKQSPTYIELCAVALLQKGPSVSPWNGPSHSGPPCDSRADQDVQGWCGPAGLQNKTAPTSISPHLSLCHFPQLPAAFPATSKPKMACWHITLSQGNGREMWWEECSHSVKGKLLKDLGGFQIEHSGKLCASARQLRSVRVHAATLSVRNSAPKEGSRQAVWHC